MFSNTKENTASEKSVQNKRGELQNLLNLVTKSQNHTLSIK